MRKELRFLCILVLLAALCVSGSVVASWVRQSALLREQTRRLEQSRSAWEQTAAEKEALQEQLQDVNNAVREASLTLEESTARAADLREDLAELQTEVEQLSAQLTQTQQEGESQP